MQLCFHLIYDLVHTEPLLLFPHACSEDPIPLVLHPTIVLPCKHYWQQPASTQVLITLLLEVSSTQLAPLVRFRLPMICGPSSALERPTTVLGRVYLRWPVLGDFLHLHVFFNPPGRETEEMVHRRIACTTRGAILVDRFWTGIEIVLSFRCSRQLATHEFHTFIHVT